MKRTIDTEKAHLTVADLMQREVVTVSPDLTLRDLIGLLDQKHIAGAPVLRGGSVLGVISASDVLSFLTSEPGVPTWREGFVEPETAPVEEEETTDGAPDYFTDLWADAGAELAERFAETESPEWDVLGEHVVQEAMTHNVVGVTSSTDVATAARLFIDRQVHRLLVIDDGEFVGILTTTDLVRAIADDRLVVGPPR